jgi:3-isopropylmalate dehydrogenase
MLMQWLGDRNHSTPLRKVGDAMEIAVDEALANPLTRTADVGGTLGCKGFAENVAARIA